MTVKPKNFLKKEHRNHLSRIHFDGVLRASLEDSSQVIYMIIYLFRLHHNIINEIFKTIMLHIMKSDSHSH